MTTNDTAGPDWHTRLFRVQAGLGSGDDAALLEVTVEGSEYVGSFGSRAADIARRAAQTRFFEHALADRFPHEKITIVGFTPQVHRRRASWDKAN